MLFSKKHIILLIIPCFLFAEVDKVNFDAMLFYQKEIIFKQTYDRINQISLKPPEEQTFENTIYAVKVALSIFCKKLSLINEGIPLEDDYDEIKYELQQDIKKFLQANVLSNARLKLVLEQYSEKSFYQDDLPYVQRKVVTEFLESSFSFFIFNILRNNMLKKFEVKDDLWLCGKKESKTKVYVEGGTNSDGEKQLKGGINREQTNEKGIKYRVDASGKVQQDKDGKTKAEASAKIEMEF